MPIERTASAGIAFARRVYGPRALGCALSFLFVVAVIYPGSPWLWGLMLFNGFVWPCIAYQLAIRSASAYRSELLNLQLDCLFAGAWVVVMQFSLLPSLLLVSMVAMNCVAAKGVRLLLRGLLACLAGVVLAGTLLGFEVLVETPTRVIWACMPMLTLYPLVVGWTCYRLAQQLSAQQRAFSILATSEGSPVVEWERWLYVLAQEFHRCRCGTSRATLARIRIDDFQALHERHGELLAEALSIRLGHLIQCGVRSSDLLSRRRPGEFWVLFLQARSFSVQLLTERIEAGFRQFCVGAGGVPAARIRIGFAEFSQHLESEYDWQQEAEAHCSDHLSTHPHEGEAGRASVTT